MAQSTGFLLLFLLYIAPSHASRILMIPANNGSHTNFFCVVGKVLETAGHQGYMFVSDKESKLAERHGLPFISMGHVDLTLDDDHMQHLTFNDPSNSKIFSQMTTMSMSFCEMVLSQEKLMLNLEGLKFDLVLIDAYDVARCFYACPPLS